MRGAHIIKVDTKLQPKL